MKKLPVTMSKTETARGIGLLLFQRIFLPSLLVSVFTLLSITPSEAEINALYFFINFLAAIVIFRNFLWAELDVALRNPSRVISSAAIGYGIYYVLSFALSYLIQWLDPEFYNLNDAHIGAMSESQFALMAVGTVLFVPLAEELLFRGVLFNKIYEKRPVLGWITSITLFSLVHVVGYIGQYSPLGLLLAFLQYLPAGIALCFAYVNSGTIFAPILFHTAINTLAIVLQLSLDRLT
ncbi:MAG: CPBP family intramembrane metalloprotease [Ruminococcaceae bacterium]|nr:CPBP family intramembrane metalloprotease [Oscillospiraceae bacterium]